MPVKSRRDFSLWQWTFWRKFITIDQNFKMIKSERIVVPLTPCLVRSSVWFLTSISVGEGPKDIIITNRRIVMPFLIFGVKEVFGEFNLWHPEIGKVPETPSRTWGIRQFLKGDVPIKKISLGVEGALEIEVAGSGFKAKYLIYHPRAAEIYRIFSNKPT
ncbi:MAG: hypothetical protein QW568_00575 [Candidatus Anstonellaceae archaeon]